MRPPTSLATAWGAGLIADVLKMLVTRVRPYRLESQGFDFQGDVWSTFGQWLPIFGGGSAGQSFPSAHVATATAFAIVLGAVYPVGQRIFLVLAVLLGAAVSLTLAGMRRGDREHARSLLTEAIPLYREIGMAKHLEMAETLLAEAR